MFMCYTPFPEKVPLNVIPKTKIPTHAFYKELLEKVKNVKVKSDCKPPKFKTHVYLKAQYLRQDFNRCVQVVNENLTILEKINRIQRTHGLTDNYNEKLDGYRKSKHGDTWKVLDKRERENYELARQFLCVSGRLPTRDKLLEDWRKTLNVIRKKAKRPIVLKELTEQDVISKVTANPLRPLVYFDLALKDEERAMGRLVIVLFYDMVPEMASNFIALCENSKLGIADKPSFLNSSFYRIFPGLYLEGGDMEYDNGCGGIAAEGTDFVPDNYDVNHNCRGTIAMIPNTDGKVNSRFTISFKPLNILNGKRPALGRVIKGLSFLDAIQSLGTKNGKARKKIIISCCGLLKT